MPHRRSEIFTNERGAQFAPHEAPFVVTKRFVLCFICLRHVKGSAAIGAPRGRIVHGILDVLSRAFFLATQLRNPAWFNFRQVVLCGHVPDSSRRFCSFLDAELVSCFTFCRNIRSDLAAIFLSRPLRHRTRRSIQFVLRMVFMVLLLSLTRAARFADFISSHGFPRLSDCPTF